MRCVSFCTAKGYDLQGLSKLFKTRNYTVQLYKNVLHVVVLAPLNNVFFFANGCFVAWGLRKKQEEVFLEILGDYSVEPLKTIETDYFLIKQGKETKIRSHESANFDILELASDDEQLKLAISYGLAQSIKLESYEEKIKNTVNKNADIVEELAKKGKISLRRREIKRRLGEIFQDRASVNLKSEHIDIPEFFWEHPSLEHYYLMTEQFLDIPRRVNSVNHKLDVLHDIFEMLMTQLEHSYSTFLEYIVILLISIEVFFSFLHYFTDKLA